MHQFVLLCYSFTAEVSETIVMTWYSLLCIILIIVFRKKKNEKKPKE